MRIRTPIGTVSHFASGQQREPTTGTEAPGADPATAAKTGSGISEGPAKAVSAATTKQQKIQQQNADAARQQQLQQKEQQLQQKQQQQLQQVEQKHDQQQQQLQQKQAAEHARPGSTSAAKQQTCQK